MKLERQNLAFDGISSMIVETCFKVEVCGTQPCASKTTDDNLAQKTVLSCPNLADLFKDLLLLV